MEMKKADINLNNNDYNDIYSDFTKKKSNMEKIISNSLKRKSNRFLMLFVQNDFCKGLIKQKIEKISIEKNEKTKVIHLKGSKLNFDISSSIYVTKFLKTLKIYIQLGYTLLLEDLDFIYTILYDFFNQNYESKKNKNYCKFTFEDKEECFPVHDDFRCVIIKLIEEIRVKDKIEKRLPSPLLNRMEKHIIEYQDFKNDDLILIFTEVDTFLTNLLLSVNKKVRFDININDLIYCYNDGELLQGLILQLNKKISGKKKNKIEQIVQSLKTKVITFYSFKMLILHCMFHKNEIQQSDIIKLEYIKSHKYHNLENFIKEISIENKTKQGESSMDEESHDNKKSEKKVSIDKYVIMTSSSYFNLEILKLIK